MNNFPASQSQPATERIKGLVVEAAVRVTRTPPQLVVHGFWNRPEGVLDGGFHGLDRHSFCQRFYTIQFM